MAAKDILIHAEQAPRLLSHEGVLLREDSLYTNHKGKEKKGIRKRADQGLARLKGALAAVLEPEEAVLYVARAQAPATIVEQLTFGHYIYYVTASLLVFTTRRILDFHLEVGSFGRWKWTYGLRGVRWGDVQQAAVKGWLTRSLALTYRNGKKDTYRLARWGDAGKIRMLVETMLHVSRGEASPAQGIVALCPDCYAVLAEQAAECSRCQLRFKTTTGMIWRSIVFPGGGYFYTGHWALGVADAFVESVLVFALVAWLLVAAGFPNPFRGPLEARTSPGEAIASVAILALVLSFEKILTIHHGKRFLRDFIPARESSRKVGWAAYAVGVYGAMALLLWAITPAKPTLTQLGPDLAVEAAEFGTFGTDSEGNPLFTAASLVPKTQGQQYGWIVNLHTTRPKVHLREEHTVWNVSVESDGGEAKPLTLVNESDVETASGIIYNTWTMEASEPSGRRTVKVFIEGFLVKSFDYNVP